MNILLRAPLLLPLAIRWVKKQQTEILSDGRPLSPKEIEIAHSVGIRRAERVRISFHSNIPEPTDPRLRAAACQIGLFGQELAGITFGYGVCLRQDSYSRMLIAHELRHVAQYEAAGSIAAFLMKYLFQLMKHGYEDAPLEIDARNHESFGGSEPDIGYAILLYQYECLGTRPSDRFIIVDRRYPAGDDGLVLNGMFIADEDMRSTDVPALAMKFKSIAEAELFGLEKIGIDLYEVLFFLP